MRRKKLWVIWLTAAWCVLLAITITGVTYAWFRFDPSTNVEPIGSTISSGETALLIAAHPEDTFDTECILEKNVSKALLPVSTANLDRFYTAGAQNRQGIVTSYRDVTGRVDEDTIHGKVYLKSLSRDCNVYLYRPGMSFGEDTQALSAMRLGLKITTSDKVEIHIFKLDEMGNTSGALKQQTTVQSNVVVGSANGEGAPTLVADPGKSLAPYCAIPNSENPRFPKAGERVLCTLNADEVATVEYWLYLEGCDENCINKVQNRDVELALSFAGIAVRRETGEAAE